MKRKKEAITLGLVILSAVLMLALFVTAAPTGPSSINITANETMASTLGTEINISGGHISKINITATTQNPHWKAFVGWVNGQFTLDDSSGSTIYDWSLTSIGGEVHAVRNSSTIQWDSVNCSNVTHLEAENVELSFTNPDDNITSTFSDTTYSNFVVGSVAILSSYGCPTLNTYNSSGAQDDYFEQVILYDGANNIYTTILEEDVTGFDANTYDFQMIVPENASETWSSSTAYYLYVELN